MRWTLTEAPDPLAFVPTAAAVEAPPAPPAAEQEPPAPDDTEEAPPTETGAGRFHGVVLVEDAWTGDGRFFMSGGGTWRDLPLTLTGNDTITEYHLDAEIAGHVDQIERQGNEIHIWGPWATTPEAVSLRGHVRSGELRGLSAMLDDVDYEVLLPPMPDEGDLATEPDENGDEWLVVPGTEPKMRASTFRIMGGTIVPHPALQECYIEDLNPEVELVATVAPVQTSEPAVLVAAGGPLHPPFGWFGDPKLPGPSPLSCTDDGHLSGHLAIHDQCHIGYPGCVTPPRSATDYAIFHHGELATAEGKRVAVGQVTLTGGHAERELSVSEARAHYDDTRSAVADVTVGEDRYGIWVNGALRPGISPATVRALLASEVSGDWRMHGGNLELVAICAVNVPGFPRPRLTARQEGGHVVSLVASLPQRWVAEARDAGWVDSAAERIAASIGRSSDQRLAALVAKVHPEPVAV